MKETILGQIVGKANHYQAVPDSNGGRRIIKDDAIRQYEKSFVRQCTIYKNRGINTPFTLIADVFFSSQRYDLDNSLKTLLDCLQYVKAITNDNLCSHIDARKHIDADNPRVEFELITQQLKLF